ncbi:MAG: FmdB family zinc ribbon protein [Gammaproteobacteria bacterium]|jgi:predicted nucleic acid-binding Zn ribbon protein
MPTYVYETIPEEPSEKPYRFEIKQSITEDTLTTHPETGRPIRKIITGSGILSESGTQEAPMMGGSCCAGKTSCCG